MMAWSDASASGGRMIGIRSNVTSHRLRRRRADGGIRGNGSSRDGRRGGRMAGVVVDAGWGGVGC